MKNGKYDCLISDLGNVLVNFDHMIAVRKILQHTPKTKEDLYDVFFDSGLTELYEEGKVSPHEFFIKIKDLLELDMDEERFFAIWNDIFFETSLNKKVHDLLKSIKGKTKLVMLSNINPTHYKFLKERYDIFKAFDKLILSYEVGYRKPAKEIYDVALKAGETTPEKAFYIDDRVDLVEAAKGYGINGVAFTGEEAFLKVEEEILR
ncbi:MAG: HAD family phosphatase [Candidatus Omnitrophota bacterium]